MRQQHTKLLSCPQCTLELKHPLSNPIHPSTTQSPPFVDYNTKSTQPFLIPPSNLSLSPPIYSPTLNASILGKIPLESLHPSQHTTTLNNLLQISLSLPQAQTFTCYSTAILPLFDLYGLYQGQVPSFPITVGDKNGQIPEKLLVCTNSYNNSIGQPSLIQKQNLSGKFDQTSSDTDLTTNLNGVVGKDGSLLVTSEFFHGIQFNNADSFDSRITSTSGNTSLCSCLKCQTMRSATRMLTLSHYLHSTKTALILSANFTPSLTSTSSFHEPNNGSVHASTQSNVNNFIPNIPYFPTESRYLLSSHDGIQILLQYIPTSEEVMSYQFYNGAGMKFNQQCFRFQQLHSSTNSLLKMLSPPMSPQQVLNNKSGTNNIGLLDRSGYKSGPFYNGQTCEEKQDSIPTNKDVNNNDNDNHKNNKNNNKNNKNNKNNNNPFFQFLSTCIPDLDINYVIYSSHLFDLIDTHFTSTLNQFQIHSQSNPTIIPTLAQINNFSNQNPYLIDLDNKQNQSCPLFYGYGQLLNKTTSSHKSAQNSSTNIDISNQNSFLHHQNPIVCPIGYYYPSSGLGFQLFDKNKKSVPLQPQSTPAVLSPLPEDGLIRIDRTTRLKKSNIGEIKPERVHSTSNSYPNGGNKKSNRATNPASFDHPNTMIDVNQDDVDEDDYNIPAQHNDNHTQTQPTRKTISPYHQRLLQSLKKKDAKLLPQSIPNNDLSLTELATLELILNGKNDDKNDDKNEARITNPSSVSPKVNLSDLIYKAEIAEGKLSGKQRWDIDDGIESSYGDNLIMKEPKKKVPLAMVVDQSSDDDIDHHSQFEHIDMGDSDNDDGHRAKKNPTNDSMGNLSSLQLQPRVQASKSIFRREVKQVGRVSRASRLVLELEQNLTPQELQMDSTSHSRSFDSDKVSQTRIEQRTVVESTHIEVEFTNNNHNVDNSSDDDIGNDNFYQGDINDEMSQDNLHDGNDDASNQTNNIENVNSNRHSYSIQTPKSQQIFKESDDIQSNE
jgi:hypothetical protein